jgi:hypothetical protein
MEACKRASVDAEVGPSVCAQGAQGIDADRGINHSVVATLLQNTSVLLSGRISIAARPARREPRMPSQAPSLVICP